VKTLRLWWFEAKMWLVNGCHKAPKMVTAAWRCHTFLVLAHTGDGGAEEFSFLACSEMLMMLIFMFTVPFAWGGVGGSGRVG